MTTPQRKPLFGDLEAVSTGSASRKPVDMAQIDQLAKDHEFPSRQPARPVAPNPAATVQRPDGRALRRTNRTAQFNQRVTTEFKERVLELAQRDGLLIAEVLERALAAYEGKLAGS